MFPEMNVVDPQASSSLRYYYVRMYMAVKKKKKKLSLVIGPLMWLETTVSACAASVCTSCRRGKFYSEEALSLIHI